MESEAYSLSPAQTLKGLEEAEKAIEHYEKAKEFSVHICHFLCLLRV